MIIDVIDAFVKDLMPDAPQDPHIEEFCDYTRMLNTCLENSSTILDRCTTSWHNKNHKYTWSLPQAHEGYKPHPNIFVLARELLQVPENIYVQMQSFLATRRRQREREKDDFVRRTFLNLNKITLPEVNIWAERATNSCLWILFSWNWSPAGPHFLSWC